MTKETTETEAEKRKRQALKLAGRAAQHFTESDSKRRATMLFAQEQGASLREIETATGVPFATVKRLIERAPAPKPE